MAPVFSIKKSFRSVIFWSIISAAFIGPGTVTTASKAGATYGVDLLWALIFSVLATIVLQEAAARITIGSGKNLGEIIALKYAASKSIKRVVFGAVAFGCMAYQAGNMLGAISGLTLVSDISVQFATMLLGLICSILLWMGNYRWLANILGLIVAIMGIAFIYVASQTDLSFMAVLKAASVPNFPDGSSLLLIGLVGTTIVPYNLFLASGISKGQQMREMRLGISLAVLIGGLISMAIMMVGTLVTGEFSFAALASALSAKMGDWAAIFFGFGLFAAGMSSSITSPLAAAVTAQSIFGNGNDNWSNRSRNFRLVWASVLLIGLAFGLTNVKPVPAIILAQAINGVLLPLVTVFLLLAVNDKKLLPVNYVNNIFSNIFMLAIVGVSCFLGINNIFKAILQVVAIDFLQENLISIASAVSLLILLFLIKDLYFKH